MSRPAFDYRKIPLPARVRLVEDIWDSIAEEANANPAALPLSSNQRAELRRRVSEAGAHPDDGIPWDDAKKELYKRGR
jgi:putative addiction module component (TIGR02574 family)